MYFLITFFRAYFKGLVNFFLCQNLHEARRISSSNKLPARLHQSNVMKG